MSNTSSIISKVWSFAGILRDDGVGYGDYLEQLTYLLFLKMAEEYSKPPYNRNINIPEEFNWENLITKRGAELEVHYSKLLRELAKAKGTLGQIFLKSQNKIQDPAKLYKIIIIDKFDDKYNGRRNVETPNLGVSTEDVKTKLKIGKKNPKWKPNILGTIINQYKRICTINARKINPDFAWQPRFYDHIIRNEESFNNISKYIINNPQNWNNDELYNQINNKTNGKISK